MSDHLNDGFWRHTLTEPIEDATKNQVWRNGRSRREHDGVSRFHRVSAEILQAGKHGDGIRRIRSEAVAGTHLDPIAPPDHARTAFLRRHEKKFLDVAIVQ